MIKIHSSYLITTLLVLLLSSCRKDKPPKETEQSIQIIQNGGVYITNEGNFQYGNATVSYYDIASETAIEDLFQPANHTALGDVCQSMYLFNNKAYIVLNNSEKIEVVNPTTFISIGTISGFTSPRYFLPVSNDKAYVTDIYSGKISIVNLNSQSISGAIPCQGATEELVLAYGKAFVTNTKRNYVYVIDTDGDIMTDSVLVSYGSNSIVEDKNGKLWVLCEGKSGIPAGLHRFNPINGEVEQSFQFSNPSDRPWRLQINGSNDTLYFLNKGVFQMAITADNLPESPLIATDGRMLYALGVDPQSGTIYLSDAIDYVQRGRIYRYLPNGSLIGSFLAGTIPNGFYFN